MVCIVITRNGEGDAWVFGDVAAARLDPIPQMDDVYATSADELVAQYGRGHAGSLLRFAEGRDKSRLTDALETWRTGSAHSALPPEIRELLWSKVSDAARQPLADPAEIVRVVSEDRAAREGVTLRSLPDSSARSAGDSQKYVTAAKERTMSTERKAKVADTTKISIATEGKKNPKREGTPSAARFALYKDGMTVKAAKEAGVKAADISYDSEKGFITLTEAPAAE